MKVKTLLPAGKSLHGMLATHYTRLKALIRDLEESRFSGYLKVEFWEYEGYLIFDTGIVVLGQGNELGIFGHKQIDTMLFVWKPLSNSTCYVIHSLFQQRGLGIDIYC